MATIARAKSGRMPKTVWETKKQKLRRDGQFLRYKLSTDRAPSLAPEDDPNHAIFPNQHENGVDDLDEWFSSLPEFARSSHNTNIMPYGVEDQNLMKSFFMSTSIGGLRGDPFNALPIENKGLVPKAFDYFTGVYAPFTFRRDNFQPDFLPVYISTIISDAMFFEQIIAFSLALQVLHQDQDSHLRRAVLYHSNNSVVLLRQRLLVTTEAPCDAIILTIVLMSTIQYILDDLRNYAVHMRGLQDIVMMRGGIEKLTGLHGLVKLRVRQVMKPWYARQRIVQNQEESLLKEDIGTCIIYPKHPFRPDLCHTISKFPAGFSELALRTRLSMHFIQLLDLTIFSASRNWEPLGTVMGAYELLGKAELTMVERWLTTAILAYSTYEQCRNHSFYETLVQTKVKKLSTYRISDPFEEEAQAWTYLVIQSTTGITTEAWQWANGMIQFLQIGDERKKALEDAFLSVPVSSGP